MFFKYLSSNCVVFVTELRCKLALTSLRGERDVILSLTVHVFSEII